MPDMRRPAPVRFPRPKAADRGPSAAIRWQQTSWGRIVIGLVLAQGLYFGLQHALLGLLEVLGNQGLVKWTWTSVTGLVFLQILQVITLTAGAVLAGGGQQRGVMLGGTGRRLERRAVGAAGPAACTRISCRP